MLVNKKMLKFGHDLMRSLHRQVVVLVPDEKLNCFDFWQKKTDNFHPGPVETPSG